MRGQRAEGGTTGRGMHGREGRQGGSEPESRISSHCRELRAVEMQANVMPRDGKEALGFSKGSENKRESQMCSCSQDVEVPRKGQL